MGKAGNTVKGRLLLSMILVCLIFFGLVVRAGYWQVYKGEELKAMAVDRKTRNITLDAKRGAITSRNGVKLAFSVNSKSVMVTPADVENIYEVADFISGLTGEDRENLLSKLGLVDKKYVKLVRFMEDDIAEQIRSKKYKGVWIENDVKRIYPYGNFAAQVVGHTNYDAIGVNGIEMKYEQILKGQDGQIKTDTDKDGRQLAFANSELNEAQDGLDVVLTIDEIIQHFTEKSLEKWLIEYEAKRVMAVIMDVKTGEILSMASKPDYNPQMPYDLSYYYGEDYKALTEGKTQEEELNLIYRMWKNYVVQENYEPGSTMKIFTTAIALEENVTTLTTEYICKGIEYVYNIPLRCWRWKRPHGVETLLEGVQNSCNPVFIQVGQQIGPDRYYDYFEDFRLTEKTGIQLPAEAKPQVYSREKMGPVEFATMTYGHGMDINPVHVITTVSAIVNDGKLMKPTIIKQLEDKDGNVVEEILPKQIKQVISEKTSMEMREVMESVITDGSGKKAYIPGIRMGGKTATSLKLVDGEYNDDVGVSSFVAVVPIDDPQIAILVVVDEPNGGDIHGSSVVGPIVKEILEDVLRYVGIQPDTGQARQVKMPNVVGLTLGDAKQILQKNGLTYNTEPTGVTDESKKVYKQFPEASNLIGVDSMVVLKIEE